MTVDDFAQVLRARWKFICVVVAIAILGALAYVLLTPARYQASTRLFVSTASDGTNIDTNDGGLFAERRVLSYTQLLTGGILAQRTIDKLGLDMNAAQLQQEVTAEAPTDTVLIDVTVRDPSPVRARDIANALSDEFVVMAAELETPDPGARPNARVIVQQRAGIPANPANPKRVGTLAIAAVLGAILGVLSAIIRDRFDDTVKRPEAIEEVTGVGVIGEIPAQGRGRNKSLIAFGGDDSDIADAFRVLRINVQNLEVADGPRVLLVAGSEPGEGRTTTAVNLALALAESGSSVVVVDGDLRRPRVAECLGITGELGLSTVLAGGAPLRDTLAQTRFPRVTALASGSVPSNPTELLGSGLANSVLSELSTLFDYVIVDSPPLSVKDAAILTGSTQGVLIVVRYGQTKRKELAQKIKVLRRAGAPLLGAVVTMTPTQSRDWPGDDYSRGRGRRGAHNK